jgi:hypothetical protein
VGSKSTTFLLVWKLGRIKKVKKQFAFCVETNYTVSSVTYDTMFFDIAN